MEVVVGEGVLVEVEVGRQLELEVELVMGLVGVSVGGVGPLPDSLVNCLTI